MSEQSTSAALTQHYASVRARLAGPAPRVVRVGPKVIDKPRVRDVLDLKLFESVMPIDAYAWKRILLETCAKHNVSMIDLCSHRRFVKIVACRNEAMYRLRTETAMSLPAIGRRLGGKDHTTVLHGIRRHEAIMRGDVYRQPKYGKAAESVGA